MKIVVDTNILFSAILNTDSKIGQILMNSQSFYRFYSTKNLRAEIWKHQGKIKKIAKLDDEEFLEIYELIMKNITILDYSLIPLKNYEKAIKLCADVDEDDTEFVALTDFIKGKLWSGDKELQKGLAAKGWDKFISTNELFEKPIE